MPNYKIPGVYVEENSSLPSTVAEVNSAIPAFIGYTQNTIFNETNLLYLPTKIQSLQEFVHLFGKAAPFVITGVTPNLAETEASVIVENQFYLFNALQLYFLNGGGDCYIVSIGTFTDDCSDLDIENGLNALDEIDEPTIYLFPDALKLDSENLAKVQRLSLKKCAELKNRFSILDLHRNTNVLNSLNSVEHFRTHIGSENLKFGAAYTPWLKTILKNNISAISINGIFDILNNLEASILNQTVNGKTIQATIQEYHNLLIDLNSIKNNAAISSLFENFKKEVANFSIGNYADDLINPFKSGEVFDSILSFSFTSSHFQNIWEEDVISIITIFKNNYRGTVIEKENYLLSLLHKPEMLRFQHLSAFVTIALDPTINMYEMFLTEHIAYYADLQMILKNKALTIPPSGAIAALYCKTDREQGVWKSPANLALNAVIGVDQLFSISELAQLNVDAAEGKSINAIRPISGYGTMVMGARTLAGNDSEWRYIAIRRLFIFIEKNIKKTTSWVIFEPNDRLLWIKVKNQIENYLFKLWQKGALVGTKPEQSYFVRCGLNITMTEQEILDGKLKIEIGLAPVRPAEFIILKMDHQLEKP